MEVGMLGLVGLRVRQHVVPLQYIVCYFIGNKIQFELIIFLLLGTRNCTGAANGGVCLGSVIDTELCDTNVSCTGKFELIFCLIHYFI